MNGVPEVVGGVEDHVHILASPEAGAFALLMYFAT